MDDYITKPIVLHALDVVLSRWCEASPTSPAAPAAAAREIADTSAVV